MAFWQWTALTAAAAALPYARDRDALPSCAALDDVAAELSRLPNVFGARRAELRELASPPLPGYRSQCFVHSPTNLPAADEAFSWRQPTVSRGAFAKDEVVGCLPAVLVIGAHKTGTTDMFHRLAQHPLAHAQSALKESNFFCFPGQSPWGGWVDYARKHVNQASSAVQEHWVRGGAARSLLRDGGGRRRLKDHFLPFEERVRQAPHIFGIDATPANTYCRVGGSGIAHVPFFARAVLGPRARVVAMTRDPVDRAYSDYKYFAAFQRPRGAALGQVACPYRSPPGARRASLRFEVSADHFARVASWAVDELDRCFDHGWKSAHCARLACHDLRAPPFAACPPGRVLLGLYDAFLGDWEAAFDRPDCGHRGLLRVAVEDVNRDPAAALRRVASFLELDVSDAAVFAAMASPNRTRPQDAQDAARHLPISDPGPVHPTTRALLEDFYARRASAKLPRALNCSSPHPTRGRWVDPPGDHTR